MPRLAEDRLIELALMALEEAAAAAQVAPVRRTWSLRLALAFLASRRRHGSAAPRWPFDHFWRALPHAREQDRWANLNASLNAIYLTLREKRDLSRVSTFEAAARKPALALDAPPSDHEHHA